MLQKIGNAVGKTVKIDALTLHSEKRRFAAMCVLVDGGRKLPSKAWIGNIAQPLEYVEGPWFCPLCHQVGHQRKVCPHNMDKKNDVQVKASKNPLNFLGNNNQQLWDVAGEKKNRRKVQSKTPVMQRHVSKPRWTPIKKGVEIQKAAEKEKPHFSQKLDPTPNTSTNIFSVLAEL